MLVSSSDIRLGAQHSAERMRSEVSELRVSPSRSGNELAAPTQALRGAEESVQISAQALLLEAASSEPASGSGLDKAEAAGVEPRMLLLAQIIARFFGRDVLIFVMQAPGSSDNAEPVAIDEPTSSLSLNWTRLQAEFESTRFEARGLVRTADGREIAVELELNLSRSFVEWVQLDLAGVERRLEDPLVINLDAASASLDATRWRFDLDASGSENNIPTLNAGSGYLVLDRNGNGVIDDGSEMFGALSGDGFADLRAYDADGNGWIDRADPVFGQLRVWTGAGTERESLKSLDQLNIGAIYLGAATTPFTLSDQRNEQLGQLRSTGIFLYQDGQAGTVQQIDLTV